jgi:hypothetical protein
MKSILLALTLVFLTGCVVTKFEEYRGHTIFEGKGGGVHKVNGFDIWDVGEPDCQYKIIGYLRQEKSQRGLLGSAIANSTAEKEMIEEAKKHGGDAVIFLSSSSQFTGANTFNNGYAMANGSSATYIGSSTTRVTTQEKNLIAVIKYLKIQPADEPSSVSPKAETK